MKILMLAVFVLLPSLAEGADAISLIHAEWKGWDKPKSGSPFSITDGQLVATLEAGSESADLTFKRKLGDFELSYEIQIEGNLEPEVGLRCERKKGSLLGYRILHRHGDVGRVSEFGSQGRLGRPPATSDVDEGGEDEPGTDWIAVRVRLEGCWIRTWVNGEACADLYDPQRLAGKIGLRASVVEGAVVEGATAGGTVRWRNLQLTDLGKRKWKAALPFTSWRLESLGDSRKYKKNQLLIAKGRELTVRSQKYPHKRRDDDPDWIASPKAPAAFETRFQFRLDGIRLSLGSPVGVLSLSTEGLRGDVSYRFETQTLEPDNSEYRKAFKAGDWNELFVSCTESRMVILLNRQCVLDQKIQAELLGHWTIMPHNASHSIPAGRTAKIRNLETLPARKK